MPRPHAPPWPPGSVRPRMSPASVCSGTCSRWLGPPGWVRSSTAAVPRLDGVDESIAAGYVSGGTRRNLDWVRPDLTADDSVTEEDLLLLADAQTSGGLLVVGELLGHPVIGEIVAG